MEEQVLTVLGESGLVADAMAASNELEEARRQVEQAEHELDLYLAEPLLLSTLGRDRFLEGAQLRRQAVDEARAHLDELRAQSELPAELLSGDLVASWPSLTVQEKRRLLHGLLERIVLSRSAGRGRPATPIEKRTTILLRGGRPLTSVGEGETASI